jgi:hypothetical protein
MQENEIFFFKVTVSKIILANLKIYLGYSSGSLMLPVLHCCALFGQSSIFLGDNCKILTGQNYTVWGLLFVLTIQILAIWHFKTAGHL